MADGDKSIAARLSKLEDMFKELKKDNLSLELWKMDISEELAKIDDLKLEVEELRNENVELTQNISTLKTSNQELKLEVSKLLRDKVTVKDEDTILKTKTPLSSSSASSTSQEASIISQPSASPSSPPSPKPSNSLQEVLIFFNQNNPEGLTEENQEETYEMFVSGHSGQSQSGHSSAWPSNNESKWRLTRYSNVLVGNELSSRGLKFNGVKGTLSVSPTGRWMFFGLLEVSQIGSGSIDFFICNSLSPGIEYHGESIERQSVDFGQVYGCLAVTTDRDREIKYSCLVKWYCRPGTKVWVEAERTSGDAIVGHCRLYGHW